MMKRFYKFLGVAIVGMAITIGLAGCTTMYQPVDVTNTMAAQINNMEMHEIESGETVQTLYVDRTGSLTADLNKYEGGVWYNAHKNKIVSIEAVRAVKNIVISTLNKRPMAC
jgi:hypothetical protein